MRGSSGAPVTAWPRAHRPLALMLPVPQVLGHCKHLSSSQHRLEFPNRRQTPEGLRSNTSGPGQGSHGSVWGSHGGYLDIPGSDLLQGSASSQSASDGAALELSVQSQTPKCPASHWGQTVPGDQSPPHLACTLLAPPSRPYPQPLVTRRQTGSFRVAGPTLNTSGHKGYSPSQSVYTATSGG